MIKSVYITRFFSGLLLIVFTLSITPKRFLHNVFAKHIDNKHNNSSDKPYQINNSGYNCDNNNVVVRSPFVNDSNTFEFSLSFSLTSYIFKNISFTSTSGIYSPLRGPPVTI